MSGFRQLEWLLRAYLRAGLEMFRENTDLVDTLFPDLSANSRSQLKDWLVQTEVGINLAFPVNEPDVPCWTIQMSGETPVYNPIGQHITSFNNEQGQLSE